MTSLIQPDLPPEPSGPEPFDTPPSPAEALIEDPTPVVEATEPEPDMFPRSYVEELRAENKERRERAKRYEDAFDGYDSDTQEALLEWVRLSKRAEQGDQEAIAQLNEMFGDDDEDVAADAPVVPEPPDYAALARQAAEEVYREREQARIQEEQILAVRSAGENLGYKFGTEDYILFVRGANEAAQAGSEDPIKAGDAAVKAYHQAVVDAYLKTKGAQAEATTAVPDGGGAAPDLATRAYDPASPEMKKWADVRSSAMARFTQG